jgi:hypothetical protein
VRIVTQEYIPRRLNNSELYFPLKAISKTTFQRNVSEIQNEARYLTSTHASAYHPTTPKSGLDDHRPLNTCCSPLRNGSHVSKTRTLRPDQGITYEDQTNSLPSTTRMSSTPCSSYPLFHSTLHQSRSRVHGIAAFGYLSRCGAGDKYKKQRYENQKQRRLTICEMMVDPTCISHIADLDPDHFQRLGIIRRRWWQCRWVIDHD